MPCLGFAYKRVNTKGTKKSKIGKAHSFILIPNFSFNVNKITFLSFFNNSYLKRKESIVY
jgi:hypothetical protein